MPTSLEVWDSAARYDNTPSHSSCVVLDTVKELDIGLLPHPPYSQDLSLLAICKFKKSALWSEIRVSRGVKVRRKQTFVGDVR